MVRTHAYACVLVYAHVVALPKPFSILYIYGKISVNWHSISIVTSMDLQPKCVHNAMNKYKTYNTVVACSFKFSN